MRQRADTSEGEPTSGNCTVCRKGDLITITMTVGDSTLSFITCHACESKWWERDGEAVALSTVIDEVTES
jgi:hypothetical protein